MPAAQDAKSEPKRTWLFVVVIVLGLACAAPFAWGIWRLLWCDWLAQGLYGLGLRAGLAVLFAGIVLCVLLLLYRLRNEDTSPSLNSGLLVIALGAILTALVLLAARGQPLGHAERAMQGCAACGHGAAAGRSGR
jgi:hypothetical protein